ncbi:hypothetical protein SCHPADRAFT_886968 [Schizopora paradoxa]|uniref:Uncharacterized protein n=1 Tax=Schizopora paradoxa TaxID=27342 RepID=A0A0H2S789_9AGAM|nr:hypothetical protein SCHPADRAFT_886968 [Schizopora paradoxa]
MTSSKKKLPWRITSLVDLLSKKAKPTHDTHCLEDNPRVEKSASERSVGMGGCHSISRSERCQERLSEVKLNWLKLVASRRRCSGTARFVVLEGFNPDQALQMTTPDYPKKKFYDIDPGDSVSDSDSESQHCLFTANELEDIHRRALEGDEMQRTALRIAQEALAKLQAECDRLKAELATEKERSQHRCERTSEECEAELKRLQEENKKLWKENQQIQRSSEKFKATLKARSEPEQSNHRGQQSLGKQGMNFEGYRARNLRWQSAEHPSQSSSEVTTRPQTSGIIRTCGHETANATKASGEVPESTKTQRKRSLSLESIPDPEHSEIPLEDGASQAKKKREGVRSNTEILVFDAPARS